jgi:hypothetical protein
MSNNRLELFSTLIFYRLPNTSSDYAHIDLMYGQENYSGIAINWVLSDIDDSEFVWYNLPEIEPTGIAQPITDDRHAHLYNSWHISKLKEITRRTIGNKPTVLRVDIPHAVHVGNNARLCISVRCRPLTTVRCWEDIVNYVSPNIVLDIK